MHTVRQGARSAVGAANSTITESATARNIELEVGPATDGTAVAASWRPGVNLEVRSTCLAEY
ncbi:MULTISPECIES: hypothetical protein [unclassified Mycobacterium]|uniref:hypothetical protein n=1 Tax=unclassified Mycobacterium TaxID=2642494 RepID=UPI000993C7D9|nr:MULTISPECIES: hypothetical protein [unclassified Mycobacterium]